MKKFTVIFMTIMIMCTMLASCEFNNTTTTGGSRQDTLNQQQAADELQSNQPTPTDIDYSLERYNLIRRTYWANGQREKANALPCEIEKPLGYIVLFAESGAVVGSFVVDGNKSS